MDERQPVEDSEFVYRRIHRSFFDPTVPIPIRMAAFRPNENDTTGLSVFRARFVQPPDTLANVDKAKTNDYYVVGLSVRDLRNLGLTVNPEPAAVGPRGHAVIPELRWQVYASQKDLCKPLLVELAKLASANIVHPPSSSSES